MVLTSLRYRDVVCLNAQCFALVGHEDVQLLLSVFFSGIFRSYHKQTLRTGWWSPISFSFAMTGPSSLISPKGQPFSIVNAVETED